MQRLFSYLLLLLFELTLFTMLAAIVEVKEIVARNCQTLKDDLLFLGGISGHFGSFSYPIGIYFTFLSKKLWTIDGSSNTIQSHFISNCSDPPCTVTLFTTVTDVTVNVPFNTLLCMCTYVLTQIG